MKRVLVLVLILLPALAICGDRVCSSDEGRTNCSIDCCLTRADDICQWYSDCGNRDPDCCSSGTCYSDRYSCVGNQKGTDCYPGSCSAGSCDNSCGSFSTCQSGFCGTQCSETCVENGNTASDFESCCECYSGGVCQACSGLSVTGTGFFVYTGTSLSIPVQLYNSSSLITDVDISVSGSLMDYVTLTSTDRVWDGDGFSYINPGELKTFYAVLDEVSSDTYGMYQIKFSIDYNGGATSYLVWIAVLPVDLMEQGREPPAIGNVGVSRLIKKMSYGNSIIPVEVVIQVW